MLVEGLRCEQEYVILALISDMTNPNAIGSKIGNS